VSRQTAIPAISLPEVRYGNGMPGQLLLPMCYLPVALAQLQLVITDFFEGRIINLPEVR
jgi:hypothetical protein